MLCLTGKYQLRLQKDNRLYLPKELIIAIQYHEHGAMGENFCFILFVKDKHLNLYPISVFRTKVARYFSEFRRRTEYVEKRRYVMELISHAVPVRLGSQFRVTLSQNACDAALLQKDIFLIGVFDHMEIWNPDVFEEWRNGGSKDERLKINESTLLGVEGNLGIFNLQILESKRNPNDTN